MLLISGAKSNVKSKLDLTAFMCAQSRKDERSMNLLREMGVEEEALHMFRVSRHELSIEK